MICLKDNGDKQLLLTFDDGPADEITLHVLNKLSHYDVKAVFFLVGKYIENRQDILKSIINNGHEIGNHSYYHHNDIEPPFVEYFKEVRKCQNIVKSITGHSPRYFRPPRGILSYKSIIIARMLRLKILLWSLDFDDWKCNDVCDADLVASQIINNISNNDILLLHDNNKNILHILDVILPILSEYSMMPDINSV